MTVLAVVAVWSAQMPLWVALVVSAGVIVYAWSSYARAYRRPVAGIGWYGDDTWVLRLAAGDEVEGQLCGARMLGPLIVLRLAWAPKGRVVLLITPDNLDGDTRRRLRMRLSAHTDKT